MTISMAIALPEPLETAVSKRELDPCADKQPEYGVGRAPDHGL